MRTPTVGDQFKSSSQQDTLGRSIVWQVTKLVKKADSDYIELKAVNEQLERKMLSARALSDRKLFSRVAKAG